jgi:hypothetical protein
MRLRAHLRARRKQRGFIINPYAFAAATGLLDSYTTGLWGPAGMSLLRGTHTGNAFRVRRSSDNTTSEIGFVGGAWDSASAVTFVGSANGYSNWNNVTLYMPVSGNSGDTTFYDVKGHPATAVGNAQVSTTLGFPTALFDGSGDRVDIVVGKGMNVSNGDVRIRFKMRLSSVKNCVMLNRYNGTASGSSFIVQLNTSGSLQAYFYSGSSAAISLISANSTIAANTTYDVEVGRSGTGSNNWQLSVDGVSKATGSSTATMNAGPNTVEVGGDSADGATWTINGHMWALSIEPGVACHTGSFTPDAIYGVGGDGYIERAYFHDNSGNYWGQTILSAQPKIIANAVALTDITFDGADDHLLTNINSGTPTVMACVYKGNGWYAPGVTEITMQLSNPVGSNKGCFLDIEAGPKIGWGVTDGVGNSLSALGSSTSQSNVLGVVMGVFDKSLSGTNKRKGYYNGSAIAEGSTGSNGTVGTSAFDAKPWYIGGLPSNTQPCFFNLRRWAVYEASPDVSGVSTALA